MRNAYITSNITGQRVPLRSAADLEPQLAWTWATSLTDPQAQKEGLEKAAKQWLRVDDQAARATIQSSGFPPELIAKLLKRTD